MRGCGQCSLYLQLIMFIFMLFACGLALSPPTDSSKSSRELILVVSTRQNRSRLFDSSNTVPLKRATSFKNDQSKPVPLIRGAAVKESALGTIHDQNEDIRGLQPPSHSAQDSWSAQIKYPDSNGYYPDVGNQPGPDSRPTVRPVYGPPPSYCPSNPSYPQYPGSSWPGTNNQYPNTPNPNSPYPNSPYPPNTQRPNTQNPCNSQYPNSQYPNQPQYPNPNQPQYPGSQCPNSQHPSSQYPNSQYPNSQYPSQYPSNYPNSQRPSGYPDSQRPYSQYPGNYPQGSSGKQWIACDPYEVGGNGRTARACPPGNSGLIAPSPTKATKVLGKTFFSKPPRDVEEVSP